MCTAYIENLTVTAKLARGSKTIVNRMSFHTETGETLGIIGQSGCGKTMTALSIFGLLPDNCSASGSAVIGGVDMLALSGRELSRLRGRKIVYIPQSGADFLNPSLKIKTHLYETLQRLKIAGALRREVALTLLRSAGFMEPEAVMDKYPFQLSGGMAQRVVLALGLAGQPNLVIADEPTRGIDRSSAIQFVQLVKTSFPSSAVIVITHDISLARLCDKLLVMHNGTKVEYGDAETVIKTPMHEYTRSLLAAMPDQWEKRESSGDA